MPTTVLDLPVQVPLPDSLASRIACHRQDSARRRACAPAAAEPLVTATPAKPAPPKVTWATPAALISVSPPPCRSKLLRNATPFAQSQLCNLPAPASHMRGGKKKKKTSPVSVTVASLRQIALRLVEKAAVVEAPTRTSPDDSFDARLGSALHLQSVDVKELVAQWDPSSLGVRKMDWRQLARKLVTRADVGELDGWFRRLDVSRTGSLSAKVLCCALRALQERAASSHASAQRSKEEAMSLRGRADQAELAAQALEAAQVAEAQLASMQEPNQSVDCASDAHVEVVRQARACATVLRKAFKLQHAVLLRAIEEDREQETEAAAAAVSVATATALSVAAEAALAQPQRTRRTVSSGTGRGD
jgi:hypothetical protein